MELLQYLALRTGCTYLSDLKYLPKSKKRSSFLVNVPLEDYPETEWINAVVYLYQQPVETAAAAKQMLIRSSVGELERQDLQCI